MENEYSPVKKIKGDRIYYIEPNDVLGHVGVKPITPDYTDFCVAFNLTGEIIDRERYDGYSGETTGGKKFTISWYGSKENSDNNVDFSGGSVIDNSKRNYLTTYYTDLSYQDIKGKSTIEGLGVESIDIQFKNYYTPTITIKFVDVRGSALFGREEAIHENGKITSDNVFGCFFTMPYPKFKLQIKGYYGREVTYQLYCSNFKGNFNSETGNFEATVTFLGYMYGILADIPMAYMMIAPYCSYKGSSYWSKHSENDLDWKLYETGIGFTGKPVKMFKLREDIKSALRGDREYFVNLLNGLDKKEIALNSNKRISARDLIASFANVVKNISAIYPLAEGHERSGNSYIFTIKDCKLSADDIISSLGDVGVKEYNKKLEIYNNLTGNKYPEMSLSKSIAKVESVSDNVKTCTFQLGIPEEIISTNITLSLDDEYFEKAEKEVNDNVKSSISIKDFIGMYPYIGNVIKNSLFHLETLLYMFRECVNSVRNDKNRTFQALNIPISNTDSKLGDIHKQIPPFVGITITENTEEVSEDESFETPNEAMMRNIGWLGDFTENAPEVEMVNSIFEAMRKKDEETKNENGTSGAETTESDEEITKRNRDVKVAIYMHLKNIYDRWLINENFANYKTGTYFKNFVFIDSFFRNISYALHVNPETLGAALESVSNDDGRFLKFISTMATKEHCSIFGFPDTFMFSDGKGGEISIQKGLEDAFKPIPYSKIGPIETNNRIVILYSYKPSEITSENNGYRGDYFDVYTDGEVIPSNLPIQLQTTGYVYDIPSFGVAFGRQDNAIFKSFKLSMENPVATEQSIKALATLASKAGASRAKVQYYGQDIYQVYSGYSYFCEFDMMGDVQIMPLMYFQLLNVPLFRGAYMVIEVSHSMKQGDMTTHVKGMRLSRNALPLTKAWFTPELILKFDKYGNLANIDELISNFVSDESNYNYRLSRYLDQFPENLMDMNYKEIQSVDNNLAKQAWLAGGLTKNELPKPISDGICPDKEWEETCIGTVNLSGYGLSWLQGELKINKRFIEKVEGKSWVDELVDELKKYYDNNWKSEYGNKLIISCYIYRHVNHNSEKPLSNHSIGSAIDVNFGYSAGGCEINDKTTKDEWPKKMICAIQNKTGNPYWSFSKENPKTTFNLDWGNPRNTYRYFFPSATDEEVKNVEKGIAQAKVDADVINPNCIRSEQHNIVKAFKNVGWGWGGTYGDTMHFSFFGGS